MSTKLLISCVAVLGLIACKQVGQPAPHFGEAVNHNIAVQTVNPNAPNDKSPIAYEGARQALAQQRYEANQVQKPADISTSTVMGASSGSK